MNNKKQSILVGGLVSSAGILVSKFLGLLYVIPYNDMLGSSLNRAYYASAFNFYSYILNIASAGLPFAIATLIARYASRNDYQTCLLVKKISFRTMAALGFIAMMFMLVFSSGIAESVLPSDKGASLETMRLVIILISLAVFIIPILSSLRGFYQGFKEMQIYSVSQILEQIARILFLLAASAIAVYVFNKDSVWALYFGVISTSIAGLMTVIYIKSYDRTKLREIKRQAKVQEIKSTISGMAIFKELLQVAIPFLLIAVFGYCDTIINSLDLRDGLVAFGVEDTAVYADAILYKATKLIAIPMILAPGFSAAIVPYITSAIEEKNFRLVKQYILDCVESVIYIALPICFALFAFAQPIMFVMFGGSNLDLNTEVLRWFALEAVCATILPIFSTLVMAVGFRKRIIVHTFIFALIKFLLNPMMIAQFGVAGMVLSSFVAYVIFAALNIYVIQKHYHVQWKYTFRKLIIMLVGLLGFYLLAQVFAYIGMADYTGSRIITLFLLAFMGLSCCFIYVMITGFCHVPQSIFKFDMSTMIQKITKRGRRS